MSNPVVTDKWAGNFDCDVCRRKRLMAEEFSKKALERYRKHGGPLKCKQCVQAVEEKERQAAAAKRTTVSAEVNVGSNNNDTEESRVCCICQQSLAFSAYNKNQWNKGEQKSKCRSCVEKAVAQEASQQKASVDDKLDEARRTVESAQKSGNQKAILKAESELAALEAEKVTGLKPIRMGRGGSGRGGSRGGRSGRSGSRGGRL